jgi:hypothetical protein
MILYLTFSIAPGLLNRHPVMRFPGKPVLVNEIQMNGQTQKQFRPVKHESTGEQSHRIYRQKIDRNFGLFRSVGASAISRVRANRNY